MGMSQTDVFYSRVGAFNLDPLLDEPFQPFALLTSRQTFIIFDPAAVSIVEYDDPDIGVLIEIGHEASGWKYKFRPEQIEDSLKLTGCPQRDYPEQHFRLLREEDRPALAR
jgi:hypothetical protein